jgi:hypothetical protein
VSALIKAARQALEALEWNLPVIEDYGDKEQLNRQHRAITSLRQAIEQAEKQEPVVAGSLSVRYYRGSKAMTNTDFDYFGDLPEGDYTLYTTPQPQQAEKQEPVAWVADGILMKIGIPEKYTGYLYTTPPPLTGGDDRRHIICLCPDCVAPQPQREWVGLTQEDIDIAFDDTQEGGGFNEFARAIEQTLRRKNT